MAGVQIRYLNQLKSFFFKDLPWYFAFWKKFLPYFFSNNINNNVDLVRGLLQNSEFSASVAQQKFQLSPFPSFFFSFSFAFKRFLKTGKGKKYISPF